MTAVFHSLQKHPSPNDRLTILVIRGVTFGSISLSIEIRIASSLQDLNLRHEITPPTCFSVSRANHLSSGTSYVFGVY